MKGSSERQLPGLLRALKVQLRASGLRQRDLAAHLGVGFSTVKRWLAGDGLDAQRLEDLCELAGISLAELVELAASELPDRITRFTPHQEQVLARDPRLFFLFFSLLNGRGADECALELGISSADLAAMLQRLARLALIRVFPDSRVRVLAARDISWRKSGPLARHFEIRKRFVDISMRDADTLYMPDFFRLSGHGVAQVHQLYESFRRELHRIADADQRAVAGDLAWHGALFLMRPLDMTAIRASFNAAPVDATSD
ncbi:MAG: helix-turn-helix transcriptional regulator [Gammaproteobacteria bacterium]|nr:helix-turn-helix transcriptional regulator [Gammaproteobacteria bacterium]MBP6053510.1 helix-turn-helix transcriptional regulator [Pseudomonadales bacterium]MBK6584619.1 helix-turn-helix transcriptional regulator [Gammaproteobacteria bacterium]MBK7170921.1 helix-turn-helix transcriptional regulator [Gammaproteobacteria bacterium]MBK7519872.1 helix-turn-helix transcriptional regulator [Gammaproteobacteria bacterium]